LLAAGASPARPSRSHRELPITAAAKRGQVAVVKALLAAGASPTEKDPGGDHALAIIARRRLLREELADVLGARGVAAAPRIEPRPPELTTVTPAWAALYAGERCATATFLDSGELGVDDRDPFGVTPLMVAVQVREHDLIRLLLERGADPTIADPSGCTAWDYGGFWKRDAPIDGMLKEHGVRLSLDRLNGQAARSLLRDEVQGYLDRGEHPKLVAAIRERRLHPHLGLDARPLVIDAVKRNDEDLVAALIDLGLPLELRSARNYTALNVALTDRRFEIAQRLADAGVNVRLPGLMQHFLTIGHGETVDWMLAHGLDLCTPDESGELPIHHAARYGHRVAVAIRARRRRRRNPTLRTRSARARQKHGTRGGAALA
jgi:ankyrin repeat protein